MTSSNQETSGEENSLKTSTESQNNSSENQPPTTSATTQDAPSFGWSNYAERVNGRFAMIGFIAILLIEALSQSSFLQWSGILN